jgi:cytoskeletal protein CcmA (bactofilin family)
MFKSKSSASSSEPTVIGKGTMIQGTVKVSGRVQIDGHIDGTLIADGHVSVGPNGMILGEVYAEELAVGGKVEGKVSVKNHLHIAPGGTARGEMRYGSLQVDRGGVIDGSTAHGEDKAGSAASEDNGSTPPLSAAERSAGVVS